MGIYYFYNEPEKTKVEICDLFDTKKTQKNRLVHDFFISETEKNKLERSLETIEEETNETASLLTINEIKDSEGEFSAHDKIHRTRKSNTKSSYKLSDKHMNSNIVTQKHIELNSFDLNQKPTNDYKPKNTNKSSFRINDFIFKKRNKRNTSLNEENLTSAFSSTFCKKIVP